MTRYLRAMLTAAAILIARGTVAASGAPPTEKVVADFQRAIADFEKGQKRQADEPDQAKQFFRSAAQRFESLVASGTVNGRLEFNLGNCYLQVGEVGLAILHYRRAQRLIPRDARLADNLSVARSRCVTTIKPSRRSALMRSVFFWHYDTSTRERAVSALGCYIAFWSLLLLRRFLPRRAITVSAILAACGVVTLAGSLAMSRWTDRHATPGVVTSLDVSVYKGPGPGYQRQFEQPLQPGVEFTLRERRGSWWNIELADNHTGWMEAEKAREIVPSSP